MRTPRYSAGSSGALAGIDLEGGRASGDGGDRGGKGFGEVGPGAADPIDVEAIARPALNTMNNIRLR